MNGSEIDWSKLSSLIPIGDILIAALVVVFLDLILSHKERFVLSWAALGGCILGAISTVGSLNTVSKQTVFFFNYNTHYASDLFPNIFGGSLCIDQFGMMIWLIACMAGALSILSAPEPNEDSALSTGEYYGLTLLAVAGMMLLAVSHDWMTLLISLEIMSISTYILTGSDRESRRSNEAALKYLILGAFSTAFMLMGMAFYYGATGSISLSPNAAFQLLPDAERHSREVFMFLGLGLIMVGTLFKVGAAPFHFWIPDVYEGAPTPVTALMAVGVKAAAFAVLARVGFETFGGEPFRNYWPALASGAAVLTMVTGNILAMQQSNVKRMLAYSGIAHTGYLMLALLVLPSGGDVDVMNDHLKSMLIYLAMYGIMTIGAFGVVSLVRDDGRPLEDIDSFSGLAKEHPGIALCMAIFMFSLAGMPPMGGFFAKFLIFRGAIAQGNVVAAAIGILTSVASLYYYLRVVVAMYMSPANQTAPSEEGVTAARCQYAWAPSMLIFTAGIATLVLGIAPGLIASLLFY